MIDQDLSHRSTWDLIPLVVNGSASEIERQHVDEHLRVCAGCRDEFAFQTQLHTGMALDSRPMRDPHAALQRLLRRIDEHADDMDDEGSVVDDVPSPDRSRRGMLRIAGRRAATSYRSGALIAAVVAQSIALAVLGALVLGRFDGGSRPSSANSDARYETLTRAAVPGTPATIRFVPAPTLTIGEMQTLLANAGLRIVESSLDNSIYALAPVSESTSADGSARATMAALARLRAGKGVLLAEPIASGADGSH
ncbi:zf-HC2 domain-containing protein [Dokdonella soli]|uniref:Putative zinc-finger domain-containing protein n=1 Tax=Dokdonella soli TaxID=529810 RepID=A0ABN1IDU2_9GAMM